MVVAAGSVGRTRANGRRHAELADSFVFATEFIWWCGSSCCFSAGAPGAMLRYIRSGQALLRQQQEQEDDYNG